jgi:hypothetical protein
MNAILMADVSRVLLVGERGFVPGGPFMVPEQNAREPAMRMHPVIRMAAVVHLFRPVFRLAVGGEKGTRIGTSCAIAIYHSNGDHDPDGPLCTTERAMGKRSR